MLPEDVFGVPLSGRPRKISTPSGPAASEPPSVTEADESTPPATTDAPRVPPVRGSPLRIPRPLGRIVSWDADAVRRLHHAIALHALSRSLTVSPSDRDYATLFELAAPSAARRVYARTGGQTSEVRYEFEWVDPPAPPLEAEWLARLLLRSVTATSVSETTKRVKARGPQQLFLDAPLAIFGFVSDMTEDGVCLRSRRGAATVRLIGIDSNACLPTISTSSPVFALGTLSSIDPALTLQTAILAV
ncbi:MAG: hypothetical protein QOK16_840 [Solirubrobacteraceae bacterium]|nr:hypothetical protein [Solirubrobacteraceae bacterium]